jgi:formylglycine-generating enzyme required for sulfatase activity
MLFFVFVVHFVDSVFCLRISFLMGYSFSGITLARHLVAGLTAIMTVMGSMDVCAGISGGTVIRPSSVQTQLDQTPNSILPINQPPLARQTSNAQNTANPSLILPIPDREADACIEAHSDLAPAMVVLPPGHFRMGTPKDEPGRSTDEGPQHWVTIKKPFAMGRCEITVAQFRRFVEETGYVTEAEQPDAKGCYAWNAALSKGDQHKGSHWRLPGFPQTDQHPVVCVSQADASAYADWLSQRTGAHYRLPTEAEWEYAVRATPTLDRPLTAARYWGEDAEAKRQCDYANGADQSAQAISDRDWSLAGCDDGYAYTAPVASFRPTLLGLYDLLGNVWEWTADCWHQDYTGAPADGSAWLEAKQGDCNHRVVRGGSWGSGPQILRSVNRSEFNYAYIYLGFRVARDL